MDSVQSAPSLRTIAEAGYPETTYEIIGVVGNTKYRDLREEMPPIAFVPIAQNPGLQPWAPVIVRRSAALPGITAAIVQRVKVLNPAIAVQFTELKSQIGDRLVAERTTAWLAGAFGVLATIMVTVGLYGIIAYLTVSRRHEIGIRLSLGSTRTQIVMLVLRDSLWLLALGLLIGIPLAAAAMRGASTLLFGLSPTDVPTMVGATAVLAVAAALAGCGPRLAGGARRSRHRPALRLTMPDTRSPIRTHALAYLGLAALFLFSVTMFARDAYDSIDLLRHQTEYARPPFYLGDANWGAVSVQPEAEARGMKFGGRRAHGERPSCRRVFRVSTARCARRGRAIDCAYRCKRQGRDTTPSEMCRSICSRIAAAPTRWGLSEYVGFALRVVVLPLVCIALGFWVAAVRIGDRSAWLLLSLLLSLAVTSGSAATEAQFGREGVLQPLFAGFGALCGNILVPALMLFGIAFPERLPLDRRFPWLKWIVAGYLLLVGVLVAVAVGLWGHHLAWARQFTNRPIQLLTGVEGDFGGAVSILALVVCAGSLGWKAITAPSRDARRRLLLLFVGAAPGVVALLISLVAARLEYSLPAWRTCR